MKLVMPVPLSPALSRKRARETGARFASFTLKDGLWDYVVLQEQSTLPIQRPEQMHQYVRLFNREIVQRGAKTVLYLTWSRRDAPETQDVLTHAYRVIAEEIGAVVVPAGKAWQKVNHDELALSVWLQQLDYPS